MASLACEKLPELLSLKKETIQKVIKPIDADIDTETLEALKDILLTEEKKIVIGTKEFVAKRKIKNLSVEEKLEKIRSLLEAEGSVDDKMERMSKIISEKKVIDEYQLLIKPVRIRNKEKESIEE